MCQDRYRLRWFPQSFQNDNCDNNDNRSRDSHDKSNVYAFWLARIYFIKTFRFNKKKQQRAYILKCPQTTAKSNLKQCNLITFWVKIKCYSITYRKRREICVCCSHWWQFLVFWSTQWHSGTSKEEKVS